MTAKHEIAWVNGEPSRPLQVCRPCPCGCDTRDGSRGEGYLTGSTSDGRGFSIWIDSPDLYETVLDVLSEQVPR